MTAPDRCAIPAVEEFLATCTGAVTDVETAGKLLGLKRAAAYRAAAAGDIPVLVINGHKRVPVLPLLELIGYAPRPATDGARGGAPVCHLTAAPSTETGDDEGSAA